ncbi:MAG: HTH-type transcriptional repressor YtrA [Pseudomonadota bacterium]|jgi:GntR family transcriptional regulator
MSIRFDILPSDAVPIYRQIVEQVRRRIASGTLAAGEELPSVRALALEHAINPMTVSKAYSLLEAEGLLERRRGMGMVVAAVRPTRSVAQRQALLEPALQAAAQQALELGLTPAQAQQQFAHCLERALAGAENPPENAP